MPKLTNAYPAHARHRASGQAVVTLNGTDVYLGPHGTRASKTEYDRVVAEWLANGRRSPSAVPDLTVVELVAVYMQHAATYYRDADGNPTSELSALKLPLGVLVGLYGRTQAAAFGPLAMEAVRNEMIAKGWGRASIDAHVGRLRRMFKWAVARELLPATVHQSLTTVAGLRAGRTAARETGAIKPVPEAAVEATRPFLSPTVAARVRVQLLTGARPGEVCSMRTGDLDRSGDVWQYRPAKHKTQHHGHSREIQIGPKAQAVLIPFLRTDPTAFLFSPADADAAHRAKRSAARRTPASCGNVPGSNRKPKPRKTPGTRYSVGVFRQAVARACDAAFPVPEPLARRKGETRAAWRARLTPEQRATLAAWRREHRWNPHRLRHTAGTAIRRQFGLEAAQTVLGRRTLSATQIYAEKHADTARQAAAQIG
jgi:integrase